jgi:predicted membrane GTPase involved in stress response
MQCNARPCNAMPGHAMPCSEIRRVCCCTANAMQVTAAMRLADGVLLVVDVLEGVTIATERAVQQAVAEGLAITLLISKV